MNPTFPRNKSVNANTLNQSRKSLLENINVAKYDSILLGAYIESLDGIVLSILHPRPINGNNIVTLDVSDVKIELNNMLSKEQIDAYLEANTSKTIPTLSEWREIRKNLLSINAMLEADIAEFDYIYDDREPEAWYWVQCTPKLLNGVLHSILFNTVTGVYTYVPIEGDNKQNAKLRCITFNSINFIDPYSDVVTIETTDVDVTISTETPPEGYIGTIDVPTGYTVADLLSTISSTDENAEITTSIYTSENVIKEDVDELVDDDILTVLAEDGTTTGNYLIALTAL